MQIAAVRGVAVAGACALLLAFGSSAARAGTITLTYGLGPAFSVEHHTGFVSPVGGTLTISVSAFRSAVSATMGTISGGIVSFLTLAGGPTHVPPYGPTYWAIAGPPPAAAVPPLPLPSLMGMFAGLTPLGSAFVPSGTFAFSGPGAPVLNAPAVGQYNIAGGGPMVFSGFFGLIAAGHVTPASAPTGMAYACFNVFGFGPGAGPCTSGLTGPPGPSGPQSGSIPGFAGAGPEVGRVVAIEPVPEPTTGALLGLGVTGLAVAARRMRRR